MRVQFPLVVLAAVGMTASFAARTSGVSVENVRQISRLRDQPEPGANDGETRHPHRAVVYRPGTRTTPGHPERRTQPAGRTGSSCARCGECRGPASSEHRGRWPGTFGTRYSSRWRRGGVRSSSQPIDLSISGKRATGRVRVTIRSRSWNCTWTRTIEAKGKMLAQTRQIFHRSGNEQSGTRKLLAPVCAAQSESDHGDADDDCRGTQPTASLFFASGVDPRMSSGPPLVFFDDQTIGDVYL